MAVTAFDKLAEKVMKRIARVRCATAAFPVILRAQAPPSLTQKKESHMEIKRNGSQPSAKGPSDWFTGTVRIDSPFKGTDPARVSGAIVTFEPGARTAWHTHPLGQTLIVTSGLGRCKARMAQSRRFSLAMWCGSRPGKSTGMARRRQRP